MISLGKNSTDEVENVLIPSVEHLSTLMVIPAQLRDLENSLVKADSHVPDS